MKSRAAVLHGVGMDWEVTEVDLDPPHEGEVLVRMAYAGVCHSDVHFVTGDSVPSKDMEDLMRAERRARTGMVPDARRPRRVRRRRRSRSGRENPQTR